MCALTPGALAATSSRSLANAGRSSSSGMKANERQEMNSSDKMVAMQTRNPGPRGSIPALVVSGLLDAGGVDSEDATGRLPGLVLPAGAWWVGMGLTDTSTVEAMERVDPGLMRPVVERKE